MTLLNCIGILFANLPQIVELVERMEDSHRRNKIDKWILDDRRAIQEAFAARDSDALKRIFAE